MRMTSKLSVVLLSFGLLSGLSCNAHAMAQISLQNNTGFWLNLYIDGSFGCGPVMPNGFCTSSVTSGSHLLDARKRGETNIFVGPEAVNVGDGTSPTWTVSYEDPDQALVKKLHGVRYTIQRNWKTIRAEYELKIIGTMLVWRMRFTWAAPNVALPRPIETWSELGRGQIVGREAHIYLQNPAPDDVVFVVHEDGNSITEKGKSGTYTYDRH